MRLVCLFAAIPPSVAVEGGDSEHWRKRAVDAAIRAAGTIDDPYRRAEALASIARVQLPAANPTDAQRSIQHALSAAAQVRDPAFQGWVLHDIVLAQLSAEDLYGARTTADRIESRRPHGAALAAIADVQLRGGDVAAAHRTAQRIRDPGARGEALRQSVVTYVMRNDLKAARAALQEIDDAFYQSLAAGDIAVAEVRGGRPDAAIALAARARRKSRAQIYGRIAAAQVDAGDTAGAAQTLKKIDDEGYRALVQGQLAAKVATHDAATAQAQFAAAFAGVEAADGTAQERARTFAQLARLQTASGFNAAAQITLRRARTEADRFEGTQLERDELLEYIARSQARAGDAAGALEVAIAINDRVARALLVRDVVTLQSDATSASAAANVARFDDPLIDTAAQFGVLGLQLMHADASQTRATIAAALSTVRTIDQPQLKPAALAALAAASVRINERGESVFNEALAAAAALPTSQEQAAAYTRIATALTERLMFLGRPGASTP